MHSTTLTQIRSAFDDMNILSNDILLIPSALYRFGRTDFSPLELINLIRSYVPYGAVVLPTFTYSFRRDEVFDCKKSMPDKKLGILVKSTFDMFDYRNMCPMFSFGAFGPESKKILHRTSSNCFGKGSVFDRFCDHNVKIISLGVDFNSGLSMFMNFEKLADVPYRSDLRLSGFVIEDNKCKSDVAIHYARLETKYKDIKIDRNGMGQRLIKEKICKQYELSKVPIYYLPSKKFRDYVVSALNSDNFCMASK
jgi:aminoglycoside N3'-acetyltransferase